MKNKLRFALEGPGVEQSELSNLQRCIARLQKVTETQQAKLFAAIVLKWVKARNEIPTVMYSSHRSDVTLCSVLKQSQSHVRPQR